MLLVSSAAVTLTAKICLAASAAPRSRDLLLKKCTAEAVPFPSLLQRHRGRSVFPGLFHQATMHNGNGRSAVASTRTHLPSRVFSPRSRHRWVRPPRRHPRPQLPRCVWRHAAAGNLEHPARICTAEAVPSPFSSCGTAGTVPTTIRVGPEGQHLGAWQW